MSDLRESGSPYGEWFHQRGMVTLSFDDGREDFFRVAHPILQHYGLPATCNVVTGWMDGTWHPSQVSWRSARGGVMSVHDMRNLHGVGVEIAAHGDRHNNEHQDLKTCIRKLREWGVTGNGRVESFASPGSMLTRDNVDVMRPWFKDMGITSARSGPVKRKGKKRSLHPDNNIPYPPADSYCLPSQVIQNKTSVKDVIVLVQDAIRNRRWCILMFHSILRPHDLGYGADKWYWDAANFEALCGWLACIPTRDLLVVTQRDGIRYALGLTQQ